MTDAQKQEIPKTFHRIWIGPRGLPEAHRRWIAEAKAIHPDWTHVMWDASDFRDLVWPAIRRIWDAANAVHRSDLGGCLLVHRFGGVYVDTDYRWLRRIDPWIHACDAFVCQTDGGVASGSIFGARRAHPAFRAALDLMIRRFRPGRQLSTTRALEEAMRGRADVRRLERRVFIPVSFRERGELASDRDFPGSCAIHQFAASWIGRTPA